MDSERNTGPLILSYSAVVVRFEIRNIGLFVQGVGFKVETGCVDMCEVETGAFRQRTLTESRCDNCFFAVDEINLVARLVFFISVKSVVVLLLLFLT